MAHLYHPVAVKPIPRNAVIRTVKGQRVATWTNRKNKAVVAPLTADGRKCRVASPVWWIEYTAANGERERAKGFRDRGATNQLAASLERTAEDVRSGRDSPRASSPENLIDHLPAFREHLEAKGNGKSHVASVTHNVRYVVTELGLTTPGLVNCDRITTWLAAERRRQSWTAENANRYVKFLRQFGRWLVKSKRAKFNPFDQLATSATNGEKSRVRRRLADAELVRLIEAARKSTEVVRGMSGPDRARLYLLASYTGLRIGSFAKLLPEAFAWEGGLPVAVTAAARIVKNKKSHTVPIHPDVAADLAKWLSKLPAGKPIFPKGEWSERGALLVGHDLALARAAWIDEAKTKGERARREASDTLKQVSAAGETFDFHALRVQFISGLALAGVPLSAAQKLADHSTPSLTSNIYSKWTAGEMAGEVGKLPGFPSGLGSGLQSGTKSHLPRPGTQPRKVNSRERA